jgi:hypothetical protein
MNFSTPQAGDNANPERANYDTVDRYLVERLQSSKVTQHQLSLTYMKLKH